QHADEEDARRSQVERIEFSCHEHKVKERIQTYTRIWHRSVINKERDGQSGARKIVDCRTPSPYPCQDQLFAQTLLWRFDASVHTVRGITSRRQPVTVHRR